MTMTKCCPFCGHPYYKVVKREGITKSGICLKCGATGPIATEVSQADEAWNTRVQEESDMLEEEPTIVKDEVARDYYCPFFNDLCNGVDCMMWISVGYKKGRCGLVNTKYINSTGCGAE